MQLLLATRNEAHDADGTARRLAPLDAALLAWLAVEGTTPRNRIAALLWPDKPAEAARNSLRQRLFQLRRQFGIDLVDAGLDLALAAGVRHDLDGADALLGSTPSPVAGEFAAWLAAQRERRQGQRRRRLVERVQAAEQSRDWESALADAHELLAQEPLSEDAHRRVMRLHYLRGDRAAALLAFDACERMLKDEVGTRPSPETLALLRTLEASGDGVPAPLPAVVPAAVLRPPRLVGRDRELGLLRQAWAAGHVVAVIGEAGLGKSRLLQAFADEGRRVVQAAGRPGDAGVPYATLARLLRAAASAGRTAVALPATSRGEIARVLPEFDAGAPRPAGEGHRLALLRAVQALLGAAEGAGVVVDDLHFADDASLDLLAGLVDGEDGAPGCRWALAWRPAEAGSPLAALHDRLVEQVRLVPVALAPLDAAALAELVDSLGLPGVRGAALAPGLLQRTGGNPLFVLETLKQAWVEQKLADLAAAEALPRPLSVGRLIERRLALLSPGALALARVASIAGVDFSIELAESVLQAGALQFADALNELEAAQVLRGTAFAHDLVFEAVRASVPQAVAALTHARVAAWLEPRGGEPARIAAHWLAAGRDRQALPWLGRAAERAGAALRRREQIAFLDRKAAIEEAAGERGTAFETLMLAAEIEVTLEDGTAGAAARCDRLDALADDATHRVRAATQRSNLAVMRGFVEEARAIADAALREALREGVADPALAQCRLALGTALSSLDRAEESLAPLEAALPWARTQDDPALRTEFHGTIANTYTRLCRFDDAAVHHREAVRFSQLDDDARGNRAITLSNEAANLSRMGAMAEAAERAMRARQVLAQGEDPSAIAGYIAMEEGMALRQLGRYASALRAIDAGEAVLQRFAPGYLPVLRAHRAACWAQLGQWARMVREVEALQAGELPSRTALRLLLLLREADAALQRPSSAPVPVLAEALDRLGPHDSPDFRHAVLIEIGAEQGGRAGLAAVDTVADEAGRLGHRVTMGPALAQAAVLALALGDADGARERARRAWPLLCERVPYLQHPLRGWLQCAEVGQAAGDPALATAAARRAGAWVDAALAGEVPAEFRDSFLHRQPVVRAARALAERLGSGPQEV